MKIQEFVDHLKEHPDSYEFQLAEHAGKQGVLVKDQRFDTLTHFAIEAILEHSLDFLLNQTHQGKNIENITRITGYFSRTAHWNKGKKAELDDRARVGKRFA
jgi:hypothetical protein